MNCSRLLARKAEYALALLIMVVIALACQAQSVGNNNLDRFPKMDPMDNEDMTQEMRRMHLLNAARQKSMVSDAERLLALARELNAGVGAGGNALSAGQRMRMAADIEKLAHNVREKMSYVPGTPSAPPPLRPSSNSWPQ
ncbi:hypothetical protein [Terracidiphilus gabretensis]|jgi:hypothetical protein|uniref:hypothetical protein n=1 Tax=Terracidiphilus gabretensis TaxID=1577687 RepID=UPI0012FCB793|nr:hypothetical protein [Terracidiphilus gabretensis]